jgi:hypothetical protein
MKVSALLEHLQRVHPNAEVLLHDYSNPTGLRQLREIVELSVRKYTQASTFQFGFWNVELMVAMGALGLQTGPHPGVII